MHAAACLFCASGLRWFVTHVSVLHCWYFYAPSGKYMYATCHTTAGVCARMHVCACTCVSVCTHVCTCTCAHVRTRACVCACAHVCGVWHSLAYLSDVCYILLETRRSPGPSPVPTFLCALCYKKIFAFSTTHNFSSSITTRCELCGPRPHGNRGSSSCGSLLWRLPWELALLQAQRGWGIPAGERHFKGNSPGAGERDRQQQAAGLTMESTDLCSGMCPQRLLKVRLPGQWEERPQASTETFLHCPDHKSPDKGNGRRE